MRFTSEHRLGVVAVTFWAVAPHNALAQEAQGPVQAQGGEPAIVVTGRGLAESAATPAYGSQVLTREQLNQTASGRIEDALTRVAGVQQFRRSDSRASNPSAQGLTLRGLGGNATSRTLVLLDGVPVADPFFGYVPLSALAPERLQSVRVIRGGGSGAFGAGAVAGTIELTSAGPDELGPWSGSVMADQRGASELWGVAAPRLGSGFAVASARWDRGGGFFTTPPAQRGPATVRASYDSWSASLRAVAPIAPGWELQARGLAYDDRRTLRFRGARTTSSGQDASLRLVGRGRWQVDILGYVQARDFSNVVISATSLRRTLDQRRTPSTGFGGKLELRPPLPRGQVLRLGADLRMADGRAHEDAYNAATGLVTNRRVSGGHNGDLGLFAEGDRRLGALLLTAGARADRWTIASGFFRETSASGLREQRFPARSGWDTSLRAGAVLTAGGGVKLRGSAYSGLRLPTLNELYRPFVVFPVTTQANAGLGNERLRGFEAGIDLAPATGVSLALTAFDNRVHHAIANVTIAPDLRRRQNVRAVHARGLELAADVRTGPFAVSGSLALTDAEVQGGGLAAALDGRRPAQTPRLAASATLAWQSAKASTFALTIHHVGAQFEDDLERDLLPAATTLDAYARLPLSPWLSLVLRGENLSNARTVTRNQGGSIDLGAPRTLWAGFRWGDG
jgi:outer membrane receptor protein involved in Fe transport